MEFFEGILNILNIRNYTPHPSPLLLWERARVRGNYACKK
jgi:hypothetical protein